MFIAAIYVLFLIHLLTRPKRIVLRWWGRLRRVPLSLSPLRVTRKKTVKKKMVAWNPGGEKLLTPGFHAAIFFFAVFFRVTHAGLSERGTLRSLLMRWSSSFFIPYGNFYLTANGKSTFLCAGINAVVDQQATDARRLFI